MIIITNAFSINMLPFDTAFLRFSQLEDPRQFFEINQKPGSPRIVSGVGHADTAAVFSSILGFPVEVHRINYNLLAGDILIVGQYSGPRLSEGATTLPEGATITWWHVTHAEGK